MAKSQGKRGKETTKKKDFSLQERKKNPAEDLATCPNPQRGGNRKREKKQISKKAGLPGKRTSPLRHSPQKGTGKTRKERRTTKESPTQKCGRKSRLGQTLFIAGTGKVAGKKKSNSRKK